MPVISFNSKVDSKRGLAARQRVTVRVTLSGDADVELWNATTPSVLITGAVRRKHLLDGSGYDGDHPENVAFRNRTRRGTYVFLDVYLPEQGASSSSYRAAITTSR